MTITAERQNELRNDALVAIERVVGALPASQLITATTRPTTTEEVRFLFSVRDEVAAAIHDSNQY